MDLLDIQQDESKDSKDYFPEHELTLEFLALALVGEVGETCNEIKKHLRGDFDSVELTGRLRDELPDILIYLVMLADYMKINLNTAYLTKKDYNNARFRSGSSTTSE